MRQVFIATSKSNVLSASTDAHEYALETYLNKLNHRSTNPESTLSSPSH